VPPSVWPQVRQWPGNGADLDFRGVVQRCRAVLVAAAPVPGVISESFMGNQSDRDAYQASAEYKEHAKSLAFCRLWCIGERLWGFLFLAPPPLRYPDCWRCAALFALGTRFLSLFLSR